eukprot:CAMPEP_0115748162 /NCGR_PEP_ID=MMETSP0272-20121206/93531_1 /TAXON_ID=71861 /ORGANISM="Scrippsiella trochoidea, Strain CCMP3099" /LENGTH=188 /DNA_ID=CAMNT_0003193167 /DNA_START=72 /DNA_END=635 /DNA_ORIENTATION=+
MTQHSEPHALYYVSQTVCSILFLLELFLRIFAHRTSFFTDKKQWHWNYFDTVLNLFSLCELILDIVTKSVDTSAQGASTITTAANHPDHKGDEADPHPPHHADRALRSSAAGDAPLHRKHFEVSDLAMILLFMILYFFGILLTQAVSDHLRDEAYADVTLFMILYFFGILLTQAVSDHLRDEAYADVT